MAANSVQREVLMLSNPQSFEHVASQIRSLASGPVAVKYTGHGRKQMVDRGIEFSDALFILKNCRVTKEDLQKGEWVYNTEGRNVDGERIVFAVVVYGDKNLIKIVSAWKL